MIFKEFFYLQKSDRKVILTLLIVIVIALLVIWMAGESNTETPGLSAADSLENRRQDSSAQYRTADYPRRTNPSYAVPVRQPERFFFDPNTADSTQLLRLGLRPGQVRSIYRYRAKGGVFRKLEDFARLYGLTVKEYRELQPFIRISRDYQPASSLLASSSQNYQQGGMRDEQRSSHLSDSTSQDRAVQRSFYSTPHKIREDERVVLNMADTSALQTVPGIGPYYARQIVRYGERLGGFVSVSQLDEIDNFPQSSKRYFIISNPNPRRLNVNKLSLNELKRHPYINYYQAKTIIDYRRLYGPLKSLNDLHLSRDFPPEVISRLTPYVCF
ncbi:MAG: helix-hairpin-helix domain-containing protein [Prevotella sp.]|nr:helix-hairpin-helix domain-containing protein [Prevotella sp.]